MSSDEDRMLAGLLIGSNWRDTSKDREIEFTQASRVRDRGGEYISMTFTSGGSEAHGRITPDDAHGWISSRRWVPNNSKADDAAAFVRQGVQD